MSTFSRAMEQRDDPKESRKAFQFNYGAANGVRQPPQRQSTPPKK